MTKGKRDRSVRFHADGPSGQPLSVDGPTADQEPHQAADANCESARRSVHPRDPAGYRRPDPSSRRSGMPQCACLLYVWTATLFLGCVTAFIVVVLLVVEPYCRSIHYKDTVCRPLKAGTKPRPVQCSCGKACQSSFACLVVFVEYRSQEGHLYRSILKENEAYISRECSYYPVCDSSTAKTADNVENFRLTFGNASMSPYPCHYDPTHPKLVIRSRRFALHHVIHGVVWTSLLLLFSIGLLVCVVRRRHCAFMAS